MTPETFFEAVDVGDGLGCWRWKGKTRNGYGVAYIGTPDRFAHRIAYALCVGPVPAGLDLDHLCRNRSCVNPSHLEPVTRQVNLLRGAGVNAKNAAKPHCPKGHALTPDNLRAYEALRGKRICLTCVKARVEARKDPTRIANALKTHCKRGHDLSNAKIDAKGWRTCRVCVNALTRARRAKA